jgi:hypothetical protein
MAVLPEPSSISMQFLEKFQGHFFRNRKNNSKIHIEFQKTPNSQCNPKQCWLKLYYRTIVTKTAWYCHRNRHADQWNRIKYPEISLHSSSNLIVGISVKKHSWRKDCHFNTQCWENWKSTCRRLNIELSSLTLYKINPNYLSLRPETLKVL